MNSEFLVSNPWENVYWFARMFINADKYGGVGADTKTMLALNHAIDSIIRSDIEENKAIPILQQTLRNVLLFGRREDSTKYYAIESLCDDLDDKLQSVNDYKILALTCEKIMVPINEALSQVPSDDSFLVESVAKALLDTQGSKGLANIINILDDIGTRGCLTIERKKIIHFFGILHDELDNKLSKEESNIILTAFCQEFERRVAQKRKGRAGRGVESITSLILKYFKVNAIHAPEHFTTGLEVDKWIKTKDGWLIGISCKRTLRERWKQAYTTDLDLLNRHKIRELWHVLTYDQDLSDEKLTEIGSHRAVLYLPDGSQRLKHALSHPGMKDYVRPMSDFIDDVKKLI